MDKELCLYILMRNDLPSMNPGKAMAQSAHASNAFIKLYNKQNDVKDWENQTDDGFGTTIVLSVNLKQLETALYVAELCELAHNSIEDPTYPYIVNQEIASLINSGNDTSERVYKDDKVFLCRNEVTCGYIFGDKNDDILQSIVGRFPLYN